MEQKNFLPIFVIGLILIAVAGSAIATEDVEFTSEDEVCVIEDEDDDGDDEPVDECVDDVDCDGIKDSEDNCQEVPNSSQKDSDEDGTGNACDDKKSNRRICKPLWICPSWSACENGIQTRDCRDQIGCDSDDYKPAETQECFEQVTPVASGTSNVVSFCGDLECNHFENCESCAVDCGECIVADVIETVAACGDTTCDSSEDCSSCPGDCGECKSHETISLPVAAPVVTEKHGYTGWIFFLLMVGAIVGLAAVIATKMNRKEVL